MNATEQWLRDQGAVRPMAPCGHIILVLGKFQKRENASTGYYPVQYVRKMGEKSETWYIKGEKIDYIPSTEQLLKLF